MDRVLIASPLSDRPTARATLELLKPVTWFPPMWAYGCGLVSAGAPLLPNLGDALLGVALAGPLVCGTSQAVNDWFDRHVDAINEPDRPIPSGRIPGRWGLRIAIVWTCLSLAVAAVLGPVVFVAAIFGLVMAWAYSAPPARLKRSGWWGPGAVGLCYEGLPWITGAAVLSAGMPRPEIFVLAIAYSIGAHGIMTLNDFKAVTGDRHTGLKSLPVVLGERRAALVACLTMGLAQAVVVALLVTWDLKIHAAIVATLVVAQLVAMRRLMRDPARFAPWYNMTGVTLFVSGMMVCANAMR